MLNPKFKKTYSIKEEGFTIVELMIVIVIIGILTAAGVFVWQAQEKGAIIAGVKSDLKNTATALQTYATKNSGKFPQYLPSDSHFSAGNVVKIDQTNSNAVAYCLVAYNASIPDQVFYYSNLGGGLLKTTTTSYIDGPGGTATDGCPSLSSFSGGVTRTVTTNTGSVTAAVVGGVTGGWALQAQINLVTAKALVVWGHDNTGCIQTNTTTLTSEFDSILKGYGYLAVDYKMNADFLAMTDGQVTAYSLVVADAITCAISPATNTKLMTYYNAGGHVMTEGNDTRQTNMPYFLTATTSVTYATSITFSPTNNLGLTPVFPYTFQTDTWSVPADASGFCIQSVQNAVIIANGTISGNNCAMAFAANNTIRGRWIHYYEWWGASFNTPFLRAGLNWINS